MKTKLVLNRFKTGWIAQITGEDPQYGLKRIFLGRKKWWKCYYEIDASEDIALLPEKAIVEVCNPSHKHSCRDYYQKVNGQWIKIATSDGFDPEAAKKVLAALEA